MQERTQIPFHIDQSMQENQKQKLVKIFKQRNIQKIKLVKN